MLCCFLYFFANREEKLGREYLALGIKSWGLPPEKNGRHNAALPFLLQLPAFRRDLSGKRGKGRYTSCRTCLQKLGHATVNHSVQFSERFLCSLVSQLGRNTERSGISPSGPRKSRLLETGFQIRPRWNALSPVSTVSSAVGTMSVPEGNPVKQKELMSFWELLDLS